MTKKTAKTKSTKLCYVSEKTPQLLFADYVKVHMKKNESNILLRFGQMHPEREQVTLIGEIILPHSVCEFLRDNLVDIVKTKIKDE